MQIFENRYFDHHSNWYIYDKIAITILADDKEYCLKQGFYVRTIREASHGDWKTALVQKIAPIPAGTILKIYDFFQNFYGNWIRVIYNGRHYDISIADLEYVGKDLPTDSK